MPFFGSTTNATQFHTPAIGTRPDLNSWENGTTQCRYIPQDKIPEVQQAIEGYQKFRQLTEQYAQGVVAQTRAQLGIGVKKSLRPNPTNRPQPSSPRTRRSSS